MVLVLARGPRSVTASNPCCVRRGDVAAALREAAEDANAGAAFDDL
jgi:hypothetical protein